MFKVSENKNNSLIELETLQKIYQLFLTLENELANLKEREAKHFVGVGRIAFEKRLCDVLFTREDILNAQKESALNKTNR